MTTEDPASIRPMLATTADAPLASPEFAYEPKYDGVRAIVSVIPSTAGPRVRLWSRLGNEKTSQFPEIVEALCLWGRRLGGPVVLDGEIVALDEHGEPSGFQKLQGRIHLRDGSRSVHVGAREPGTRRRAGAPSPDDSRVALIAFDVLRDGDEDLRRLPLRQRRERLVALVGGSGDTRFRLSHQVVGDGRPLYEDAQRRGWEGLLAKQLDAPYHSGRRSPVWRKLKLVRRQVCVVGGWTAPRGSRPFLGALLLGVYDTQGRLSYVGHTGAGFTDAELGRVWKRMQGLKTKSCPFAATPRTNERPFWVRPALVAEVKFTEWTADGKLRHPTYLGLRDDIRPESVQKEPDTIVRVGAHELSEAAEKARRRGAGRPAARTAAPKQRAELPVAELLDQLQAIESNGGDGMLRLGESDQLAVSNLGKVFWPKLRLTKGDLFRHYVRVAPFLLPVLQDRPLVMKRYPNGVEGKPFYQHRAPTSVPAGVRMEAVSTDAERRTHLVGGGLKTLLYTAQLASISQDPWFSRLGSDQFIDHVAIDLDPPEGLPFARVLDVARWVRDELAARNLPGFPKTSGSGGLHIYVPMPRETPYEAGLLFCQIIATLVARKHEKLATVERAIAGRGRRIYVDYLQNIRGKTLASAYSARANDFAGVSTPLTWTEVDEGVSPRDFTVRNFAARLEAVGDLWKGLTSGKTADLRSVIGGKVEA